MKNVNSMKPVSGCAPERPDEEKHGLESNSMKAIATA